MTCLRQADQWPLLSLSRLPPDQEGSAASCQQSQSNNNRKEPLVRPPFFKATKFSLLNPFLSTLKIIPNNTSPHISQSVNGHCSV
uniref:Ovule protein n=1 Tax=Macrostomum lignano TaxID=282301 RepID=A0A1I8FJU3_9PLAT